MEETPAHEEGMRAHACREIAAGKDATAPEHIKEAMVIPTELVQFGQNGGTLR